MALGGAAVWPLAARAQQSERVKRIGVIMGTDANDTEGQARVGEFNKELQRLGWGASPDVQIDNRWAAGDADRARVLAAELIRKKPDVIVANSTPVLEALRKETRTTPIVFVQVVDPVGQGLVESLARPGGNITGFTHFEPAMGGKWMEVLKEIAPSVTRVAFLFNPNTAARGAGSGIYLRSFETVASAFAVVPFPTPIQDAAGIERAITAFAHEPAGGLLVPPDTFNTVYRDVIIGAAARHRLPAVYPYRYYVTSGGLASYGVDLASLYRGAAAYVDRILRGENPATLPVQGPTKFELVINLKTAASIGLTIPSTLLSRADEVIE